MAYRSPEQNTPAAAATLVAVLFAATTAAQALAAEGGADRSPPRSGASTADHSKFPSLQGPFSSGPEVTAACLRCHTEGAKQIHDSIHWTWEYAHPRTGQQLGKRHVINNYCGSVATNYARCSSCHVGFGWDDADFDFGDENSVDCLACHDTTGDYTKSPTGAGHPTEATVADLARIAQHVGKSTRASCGSCHFYGGGGDGVKHGDLDSSLIQPPKTLDVHMAADSLDFSCSTCHEFIAHRQQGSRYLVKTDAQGRIAIPGRDSERPACESCHGRAPHASGIGDTLNQHVERIACQTCHIPSFSRGGVPTMLWWDWSEAGHLDADGKPFKLEENGRVVYNSAKGALRWGEDLIPEYRWFNGTVRYTLVGDAIDPETVVALNHLDGGPDDPAARIWPFKVMQGVQPYDVEHKTLVVKHLFGDTDAAFWKGFDRDAAIRAGMEGAMQAGESPVAYSGSHDFVRTEMFWSLNHMVAPANQSLDCADCHSPEGRMDGLTGVYLPGRDSHPQVDRIGGLVIAATLLGVLLHGLGRFLMARRARART
ncbi:tetrathionate reductase family octaheme c-type cytochrome [Thiohalocapsa marina]|uniref:Tetrathionate reductase family octaheme c-type cytochrome n=1 Tax=Thiohalocapsa marina TaxID=424902 RepID=A0A5M8FSV6_9GAMM|nr:tetrathionate reductase family octaheme c-type cytochrome [Thiohalocapsa marina]